MNQSYEVLKLNEHDNGILHITLCRPNALNALNQLMMSELWDVFKMVQSNQAIKGLLLSGEGKGFCAGADINQLASLTGQTGIAFARAGQKLFSLLETLGKPSIAAIKGFALGGGCELAMAATLRIAEQKTVMGQPEIKLGIIPGFGGTQRLSRFIGKGRALEICLTGRLISSEEALSWGLVNAVVSEERLYDAAMTLLQSIIKQAPAAQKSIMDVIHQGYNLSLEEALAFEAAHFGLCCATSDKREGVDAFLQKRTAQFTGE